MSDSNLRPMALAAWVKANSFGGKCRFCMCLTCKCPVHVPKSMKERSR